MNFPNTEKLKPIKFYKYSNTHSIIIHIFPALQNRNPSISHPKYNNK